MGRQTLAAHQTVSTAKPAVFSHVPNSSVFAVSNVRLQLVKPVLVRKESNLLKCRLPEKMSRPCLKGHPNISVQRGVFIRRERETRTKIKDRGVGKFSVCRPA